MSITSPVVSIREGLWLHKEWIWDSYTLESDIMPGGKFCVAFSLPTLFTLESPTFDFLHNIH